MWGEGNQYNPQRETMMKCVLLMIHSGSVSSISKYMGILLYNKSHPKPT